MGYRKKTWQEKLVDKEGYPKTLMLEEGFPCYNALHKMGADAGDEVVLVNPSEIVDLMRLVPYGRVITLKEICQRIAEDHQVKACCTLTSGIHVMTAAKASVEAAKDGMGLGIPYWRTLKIDGHLNDKYPGGVDEQRHLLEGEGHIIVGKGKSPRVMDFEMSLFKL
jgi:alkylated DNA nucleotide flippase Atl1